jgi:hypothetical protein
MLPRRLSACEPGVNHPPLTKKRNLPQMLNKVSLIGYTGKPVEQKYTAGGTAVARVLDATSKRFKKAKSGSPSRSGTSACSSAKGRNQPTLWTFRKARKCSSKANCSTESTRRPSARRRLSGR